MNKDLTVERVSHADSRRKGVLSRRGSGLEAPKPQAGEGLELLEKPEEAGRAQRAGVAGAEATEGQGVVTAPGPRTCRTPALSRNKMGGLGRVSSREAT